MSKLEKNMQQMFGLTPSPKKEKEVVPADSKDAPIAMFNNRDEIIEDYVRSRDNIKKLLDKTNEAIENAMDMAQDSESPRAYEVLSTLLQTAKDLNIQYLENQKRIQELMGGGSDNNAKSGPTVAGGNHIKNAIFVGSTEELAKLIKQEQDGEEG